MGNEVYKMSNEHLVEYLISKVKLLGWLENEHSIDKADDIERVEKEIKLLEIEIERRMK